tara:strand:- start:1938 stop:3152 length:1215 start_codon:yes stop_codon:yes gene_type:complete
MSFISADKQLEILLSNVDEVLPENELFKKLNKSKKNNIPLNVKLGCDPSRPDLHIGHSVVLNKLREFQELGHNIVLVVGDFTAMIGDPTGRNKTRPQITIEETKINSKTYIDQVSKIINIDKTRIVYNSKWLNDLNFGKIISLCSKFTLAQFLARDDFNKRYNSGKPISLHEFMYPLAQAYDSVYLRSDIEIGGTDQKFNLLLGRELQKEFNLNQQVAMTMPLIEGTDGLDKMSKSYNNFIAFNDTPEDMYGKVLSIPDKLIIKYFSLVTNVQHKEIQDFEFSIKANNINYRDLKRKLAREIVSIYYDNKAATTAEVNFDKIFINKEIPDNIPEIEISSKIKIVKLIKESKLVESNSEIRRLIKQNAIRIDNIVVSDIHFEILPDKDIIIKIGKRKFLKVKNNL